MPLLTTALVGAFDHTGQTITNYDTPIDGLEDGLAYYVVKVNDNTIRLVASKDEALGDPSRA